MSTVILLSLHVGYVYKYLGTENGKNSNTSDINNKITLGRTTIKRLYGISGNGQYSRRRKLIMYNTVVKSNFCIPQRHWDSLQKLSTCYLQKKWMS